MIILTSEHSRIFDFLPTQCVMVQVTRECYKLSLLIIQGIAGVSRAHVVINVHITPRPCTDHTWGEKERERGDGERAWGRERERERREGERAWERG
jgi:hypothetical protein